MLVRSRWVPPLLLAGIALAFFLPAGGFGVPLCSFKAYTGLPCPGCGLTRSLIDIAHGDLRGALVMNPIGLVLFPLFAALGLLTFTPAVKRRQIAAWIERHPWSAYASGIGLAAGLLVNGIARIVWIVVGHHPSIW
jgi:hypothetical protein